jgi:N-methylhydantoinase A/oxoprolinase/acetone carboxylase beta subunit
VQLDDRERRIVALLSERPHSRTELVRLCECAAPQLLRVGRLRDMGIVRLSGPTPTDALHVLGQFTAYDEDAARLAMRAVGRYVGLEEEAAARRVVAEVERLMALAVMRRELTADGERFSPEEFHQHHALLNRIVGARSDEGFRLLWQQERPVIGIGAPVGAFLPGACRRLGTEPIVPEHAGVANAVGAVISRVSVTDRIHIRPGQFGGYVMFAADERREFGRLEEAHEAATEHLVKSVRRRARRFGSSEQQVRVQVVHRIGRLNDGGTQLLEVELEGRLAGAPTLA